MVEVLTFETPEFQQIALEFKTWVQQRAISEDVVDAMSMDVNLRQTIYGEFLMGIRMRILTDSLPPETVTERRRFTYEIPSSTWQMFKLRNSHQWWLARLVERYPVRYERDPGNRGETVTCSFDLERYRTYPQPKFALPERRFGKMYFAHEIRNLQWRREDG